ncbi:MAG: AAA family ATPase [Ammonifex sp.]|nr:MAG: AAA family ATPase [Ammonifex sp.]
MSASYNALVPDAAKELLCFLYGTSGRQSVLLLGPPGVGKSALVRETAAEIAHDAGRTLFEYNNRHLTGIDLNDVYTYPERYFIFVDLRLTETEPVDLMGRPVTVRVGDIPQLVYQPAQWAALLSVVPGILFLDEITNVHRPDVLAAAYKLIQDRTAGFTAFCCGVQVVAAGNSPKDSAIANLLPSPLLNRVYCLDVQAPQLNQWARWMSFNHQGSEEKVLAYLYRFPGDFCRVPDEDEALGGYPTPRSYTFLARDLAAAVGAGLSAESVRALCVAALGAEVGEKFFAFWRHPVPTFAELKNAPDVFSGLNIDEKYIAVVAIGQGIAAEISSIAFRSLDAGILEARGLLKKIVADCAPLLEAVAAQTREYLGLLWFTLANHIDSPWREAFYFEVCARSCTIRKAYADIGNILKWPA